MIRQRRKVRDGHQALRVELIYREKSVRWFRSGRGGNWRQYRLSRHWHVKIVWPPKAPAG